MFPIPKRGPAVVLGASRRAVAFRIGKYDAGTSFRFPVTRPRFPATGVGT